MTEISADKKPEINGIFTVPTPAANGAETANAISVSLRPKSACFPNAVRAMEGRARPNSICRLTSSMSDM